MLGRHAKKKRAGRSRSSPALAAAPAADGGGTVQRGKAQSHVERVEAAVRFLADELKRGPAVASILDGATEHREPGEDDDGKEN